MLRKTFRRYSGLTRVIISAGLALLALRVCAESAAPAPAPSPASSDAVDAALAQARERHRPVLASFQSVDCDACYYLAQHVRSTAEWKELGQQAMVVDLDADAPDGDRRMQQWQIRQLPTAIVLDAQGRELGRLVGVRTHGEYLKEMHDLLSRTVPVDELAALVLDARAPSIVAAREYLAALYAREDADHALRWWDGLPAGQRESLEKDKFIKQWVARLRLLQASQANAPARCAAAAPAVFAADLGCERPIEVQRVMDCTAELPQAQRQQLLAQQKVQLAQLAYSRDFVGKRSCADGRATVLAVAELDQWLGYPKAAGAMFAAAIDDTNHRLRGDLHKDRALADDLRAYLDHAGRLDELEALYPKLIAAYPADPVYEYRYAQSLVSRGRLEPALPHFEHAAARATGRYRLTIAQAWVQVLIKLGRADQARLIVDDTVQTTGPWFPEQTAKLRAMVTNAS